VLLSYLKLNDGKRLCLSLDTSNPDIAKRHMRLLVETLLDARRLSPGGKAAKVYGPKKTDHSRLDKVYAEIKRLKALPDTEYGSEALSTAKRWRRPVGIIHHLTKRKPQLSAGTFRTRRMRARKRGRQIALGKTWEHRPQGGKLFGWNGNVLAARIQIGNRSWRWALKGFDKEEAEAVMAPVRVARKDLHGAAMDELNCELGTNAAVTAAATRAAARARLAQAIIKAGGPAECAEFVLHGPHSEVVTNASQPGASRVGRRALKLTARENCVKAYMKLIDANPDGAPEPRDVLALEMINHFHLTWDETRDCRREAIRRTGNFNWLRGGRPRR
jgi:hypothetical protein